jgi:hypothetical protein
MAAALTHGTGVRDQQVIVEQPNGKRIQVIVNIAPIQDDKGAVLGVINCFQPVS